MKTKEQELYCVGHRVGYVLSCDWYNTEICNHGCVYAKREDRNPYHVKKGMEKLLEKD